MKPAARDRPRRRSVVWGLSLVLAVATGVTIAQTVAVTMGPVADPMYAEHRAADVVAAFYEAANAVIRTGDVAALDPVVAPDFADHVDRAGVTPDRAGLGRYLAAIHATNPRARYVVEDLVAVGDRVLARAAFREGAPRTFLGVAVRGVPDTRETVDVFHVKDRRVGEHWGDAGDSIFVQTLRSGPVGMRLPDQAGFVLERITLEPGDRISGSQGESRQFWLESGRLRLAVDAASVGEALLTDASSASGDVEATVGAGNQTTLEAGSIAVLPPATTYTLSNDGSVAATALVATVYLFEANNRTAGLADPAYADAESPWPAGIKARMLADGYVDGMTGELATSELGRMTFTPGAVIPEMAPQGALLLVVESGTLDFSIATTEVWVRDGMTGARRTARPATLAPGDAVFAPAHSLLSFGNLGDSPAVLTVFTVSALT